MQKFKCLGELCDNILSQLQIEPTLLYLLFFEISEKLSSNSYLELRKRPIQHLSRRLAYWCVAFWRTKDSLVYYHTMFTIALRYITFLHNLKRIKINNMKKNCQFWVIEFFPSSSFNYGVSEWRRCSYIEDNAKIVQSFILLKERKTVQCFDVVIYHFMIFRHLLSCLNSADFQFFVNS